MAAIPRISETRRQDQLVPGQLNNNFVRANEYNRLIDRVNSITTTDGVIDANIQISGILSGNLVFEGTTADDYEVTVTPGDPTADRTITLPDLTGTIVVTEGAQTINGVKTLGDTTEASSSTVGGTILSGGLAVAKKAFIGTALDVGTTSNLQGAVTFGAGNVYKALTTQTALAGGAQAGTALSAEYMNFTVVATALDSAQLPVAVLGSRRIVKNSATSKLPMTVFGQTGDTIGSGAANAPVIIGYGEEVIFTAISATAWRANNSATDIVSGIITEERTLTATEIVGTSAGDIGHASGAELVSAPGAGYALEFLNAIAIYDFATAAYTGGGDDTSIRLGSGGAAITGIVTSANLLGAAGDKIVRFSPLSTAALPVTANVGISINSTTAWTQPGTAAGVVRVQTSYRIHKTGL